MHFPYICLEEFCFEFANILCLWFYYACAYVGAFYIIHFSADFFVLFALRLRFMSLVRTRCNVTLHIIEDLPWTSKS